MSYAQGPIKPRHNDSSYQLPYVECGINGTTCDAESNELFVSTPYTTAFSGNTGEGYSKIFVTNSFGANSLQQASVVSGFNPDFYISSPTEINTTWTPFEGATCMSGATSIKYEVMYIRAETTTINGNEVLTDIRLFHSIENGGNTVDSMFGSGLYRKLGTISTH